ncbi:MAG: hypothetical protein AAFP19_27170, partial [Bacteroidota bacterium]
LRAFRICTEKYLQNELTFIKNTFANLMYPDSFLIDAKKRAFKIKNDLIHFYSNHAATIKRGMVIGFYLRAFRICTEKYLQNELTFIKNTFANLMYPNSFLIDAKKRAFKIKNSPRQQPEDKRRITVPTNTSTQRFQDILRGTNLEVVVCWCLWGR